METFNVTMSRMPTQNFVGTITRLLDGINPSAWTGSISGLSEFTALDSTGVGKTSWEESLSEPPRHNAGFSDLSSSTMFELSEPGIAPNWTTNSSRDGSNGPLPEKVED